MTMLRRLAVAFTLVLLTQAQAPAAAVERILSFVSDVTVERSGDLAVTETIRLQAEGQEIRRGILRDFPTTYSRPDGTRVAIGFTVESVQRDGAPEAWATEGLSNGVRIRIGSADVILATGPHEYVIRYRTTRQIGFFGDYDELYWNATGNGWTFPIDVAEARITLPATVPLRQTAVYTGPQGGRGQDATIIEQRPGTIVFRTTRPLPPRNGLTVAAGWDKGVVEPPTTTRRAAFWLEDNAPIAVSLVGLLLILGYYVFAWRRVGRDPPGGTIIPLFAPPTGMSPPATRYVDRMGFDDRCFATAVIDLGVNGHLKIVGSGKSSVIEQQSGGRALPSDERAMEGSLFKGVRRIELVQANHVQLGNAKSALKDSLKEAYVGTLFHNNYGWSSVGLLLTIVLVAAVLASIGLINRNDLLPGMIVGMVMSLPFVMGGAAMIFNALQRSSGGGWLLFWGLLLAGIAVAGGLFMVWAGSNGPADFIAPVVLYLAAAVCGLGFYWLKAPSPAGRKIMDEIDGFRQYLGVAEEERLNALNPPDKTPELFEKFLPYAVALDCQNAWAKRFAGVLAVAGTAAAAQSWYQSDRDWNDPVSFVDHLSGDLTQTISSASTAPGSDSGSSGGGSSGGGGGGGGGSGW